MYIDITGKKLLLSRFLPVRKATSKVIACSNRILTKLSKYLVPIKIRIIPHSIS